MSRFEIQSKAGQVFGVYEGATEKDAFLAMLADSGAEYGGAAGTEADWIIKAADDAAYVTYTRDDSGIVTRTHAVVCLSRDEQAGDYPHAEPLKGWPERIVYWQRDTGASVGVAPRA